MNRTETASRTESVNITAIGPKAVPVTSRVLVGSPTSARRRHDAWQSICRRAAALLADEQNGLTGTSLVFVGYESGQVARYELAELAGAAE